MSLHYLTTPFKLECCEAQQDWPPPTRNPDGNSTACSHSTSVPHITRLPFRRSIVRFARTQLCGHTYSPPTLAAKLSPSSATSWQTAHQQETHAQARIAGASHLLLPRPCYRCYPHWIQQHILRAWIYGCEIAPVTTTTTATALQSCSLLLLYYI